MHNSLVKRSHDTLLVTGPNEEGPELYKEPVKKVKKLLHIDIPDPYPETILTPIKPPHRAKSAQISMLNIDSPRSCRSSTSTPPRIASGSGSSERSLVMDDLDDEFDDFYKEEEFYNITMKKCNKRNMEDRATCEKEIESKESLSFFGIYDGHRNSYSSKYLEKYLVKRLIENEGFYEDRTKTIKQVLRSLDTEICQNLEKLNIHGGSTALFAMVGDEGMLVSNIGDSKAVIVRGEEMFDLTIEHNATNENEKSSIVQRGGWIIEKKVNNNTKYLVQGTLEVTRSMGDRLYKKYITCEPDITEYKFHEKDNYVILASDGFWKVIDNEHIKKIVKDWKGKDGLSKALVEKALEGTKSFNVDNITLIVIDIEHLRKYRKVG